MNDKASLNGPLGQSQQVEVNEQTNEQLLLRSCHSSEGNPSSKDQVNKPTCNNLE
jgi:hypothetical protein